MDIKHNKDNLKREYFAIYLIIFILFFLLSFLCPAISLAQTVPLAARDNVILMALSQLQAREDKIIRDSMEEAQMKLLQGSLAGKVKKDVEAGRGPFSLKNLPSKIHPYVSHSVSILDNVDSHHDFKKSTIVNTVTPGFKMNLQDKARNFAVESHINNQFYNNRRRSNAQSAQFDALANFNFKRCIFTVSNNYYTNYIASEDFGVDNSEVQNYWSDAINLVLVRNFNRIGFDLGYGRTSTINELASKQSDTISETISFNHYLRIASKTRFIFGYNYVRSTYVHMLNPDNSLGNNFSFSLAGVLSSKITALGEMNYAFTDNKISDDSKSTTFSGKLSHKISTRSNLSLGLTHSISEAATKSSNTTNNNFQLSGNHRLAFNPKLSLSFNSAASYTHYPKGIAYKQIDKAYALGLGLSYAFRPWVDFSMSWSHALNTSNVSLDTELNTFLFSTQARF